MVNHMKAPRSDTKLRPPSRLQRLTLPIIAVVVFAIGFPLAMENHYGIAILFIGAPVILFLLLRIIYPSGDAKLRFQRRMAGECVFCGYSMRGNVSAVSYTHLRAHE